MAIKLLDKPNVEASSVDYPFGSIQDVTGLTPGTPVSRLVYGDFHQFFEKLMDLSGITHNDLPDNETNGYQLVRAFARLANGNSLSNYYSVSQSSTSDPVVTEITQTNLLGFSGVSASRITTGTYRIDTTPALDVIDGLPNAIILNSSSGQATSAAATTIECYMVDGYIGILTKVGGTLTDGVLNNYVFEIKLISQDPLY